MKPILLLIAEIGGFILLVRWLYVAFVMPATASKFDWYGDYLQLCDFIKNRVHDRTTLDEAIDKFYLFTRDKEDLQNPTHRYCAERVVKLLKQKHKLYRTKTLTA